MKSTLFFDSESGRMGILRNGRASFLLHCGDCFALLLNGRWHNVRIEHAGNGWYLVGVPAQNTTQATAYEGFEARLD